MRPRFADAALLCLWMLLGEIKGHSFLNTNYNQPRKARILYGTQPAAAGDTTPRPRARPQIRGPRSRTARLPVTINEPATHSSMGPVNKARA